MPDACTPDTGRRPRRSTASTVRGLIAACHVQPSLAVTAFTTALAVASGHGRRSVAVGAATLSGQLAVGWSNDFLDRSIDARAGRLEKPIVAGIVSPDLVRNGAILAATACVPLSLLSGRRAAAVHLTAVGAGLAYNAKLKRTPMSIVAYAGAFGAVPAFVALAADQPRLPRANAIIAAALLGAGAHCINVLPDIAADEITGVRGFPQRLGPTRAVNTGASLLAASTLVVGVCGPRPTTSVQRALIATSAAAIAAVIGSARTGRRHVAWTMSLGAAAATVALSVTQTYTEHTRHQR